MQGFETIVLVSVLVAALVVIATTYVRTRRTHEAGGTKTAIGVIALIIFIGALVAPAAATADDPSRKAGHDVVNSLAADN